MREMPRGFNKKPDDIRKEMMEALNRGNIVKNNQVKDQNKKTPAEIFRANQNIKRGLRWK